MKYLIPVRHGANNCDGDLSKEGVTQIECLLDHLRTYTNGKSVRILSSRIPRAKQSAGIIASGLNAVSSPTTILSETLHSYDPNLQTKLEELRIFAEEEGKNCDVLILVTHQPQTKFFPQYYMRVALGVGITQSTDADYGCAPVIDVEGRTIEMIPKK